MPLFAKKVKSSVSEKTGKFSCTTLRILSTRLSPVAKLSNYLNNNLHRLRWSTVVQLLMNISAYFGKKSTTNTLCHEIIALGNDIAQNGTLTGKGLFMIVQGVLYDSHGANTIP